MKRARSLHTFLLFVFLCSSRGAAVDEVVEDECTIPEMLTEDELESYNGTLPGKPVLLSLSGVVYDVSTGPYHRGESYAAFAGRACTRGVALPSLKPSDISDDLEGFTDEQLAAVVHWEGFFREKYSAISRLVPDSSEQVSLSQHLFSGECY